MLIGKSYLLLLLVMFSLEKETVIMEIMKRTDVISSEKS